jgi:hypothetical protein
MLARVGSPPAECRYESTDKKEACMTRSVAAMMFLCLSATTAGAVDMNELAPCRLAAAKLCDRAAGMNWSNMMRCGATLAANSHRVGEQCREVLKRYGQL